MERDLRDPTAVGNAFLNELEALRVDAIARGKPALSHRDRVLYAADMLPRYDIPNYTPPSPSGEQGGQRRLA